MTSFDRGDHPVGVRTVELHDPARDRALTVEVWYPADGALAGADRDPARRDRYLLLPGFPPSYQHAVRDAAPAPGRRPLIVFSHGLAGHRRQSTFYCTHLASHGYAVIAPDHAGNTFRDLMGRAMPTDAARWADWMRARPADVRFLIDRVADLGLDADPRASASPATASAGGPRSRRSRPSHASRRWSRSRPRSAIRRCGPRSIWRGAARCRPW